MTDVRQNLTNDNNNGSTLEKKTRINKQHGSVLRIPEEFLEYLSRLSFFLSFFLPSCTSFFFFLFFISKKVTCLLEMFLRHLCLPFHHTSSLYIYIYICVCVCVCVCVCEQAHGVSRYSVRHPTQ